MATKRTNKKPELNIDQINASLNNREQFPTELIACIVDHGTEALRKYLEDTNAPDIALELLDALTILTGTFESRAHGGGPANGVTDEFIASAIGTVGRGVVELGSHFISPSGEIQ